MSHATRPLLGVLLALSTACVLALHALGLWTLAPVRQLDALWHDTRVRIFAPDQPDLRLAVVEVDERSLAEVGRWPWSRAELARLVDLLVERHGATVVGLDLILAEPETSEALRSLQDLMAGPLAQEPQAMALLQAQAQRWDGDRLLAESLRRHPVVLGFHVTPADAGRHGVLPRASATAGPAAAWPSFDGYGASLPALTAAAQRSGFLNAWVDPDGARRQAPLLATVDTQAYEPFSLALARATAAKGSSLRTSAASASSPWVQVQTAGGATWQFNADVHGNIVLPYRAPSGWAQTFSAADILSGKLPAGALRGRTVLVGVSAAGLGDRHITPVSESLSGVQCHAALLSAFWDQRVPHVPVWAASAQVLALVMLLLAAWPLRRMPPAGAATTAVVATAGLLALSAWAWASAQWAVPVAAPALLCGALLLAHVGLGHAAERRERQRVEALFGQYVPPELVQRMSRDPQRYNMQGRSAELTVLFADLHGFTRISEQLAPVELAGLMNEFFSEVTDIVREHGGTLDKYIGDSVMAFWGAPLDDPLHAQHALAAALDMQARLPALNARFRRRGWPELSLGVGINSGSMVVGDLGSRHRRAYTVIGDAVNVAARLQDLTARLGQGILLGADSARLLGPAQCRELGPERLRGRQEPVVLFVPVKDHTAKANGPLKQTSDLP